MEAAVIAAMISGSAAVIGPIITYYVTKGRNASSQFIVTKLHSRAEVYEKAAILVKSAQSVLDTSWGSDEANLTNLEKEAAEKFLKAKRLAVARDNTSYRELFTLTNNDERSRRYEMAVKEAKRLPAYLVLLLEGIDPHFPLVDFLIADRQHVILSLLSSGSARTGHRYLYLNSPELAELLTEYFDICWQYGNMNWPRKATLRKASATDRKSVV